MKEDSSWRKAQRDSKESILTVRRHFKTSWHINNLSWLYHGAFLRESLPHVSSTVPLYTWQNRNTIGRYVLPHSLEHHFLALPAYWMVTGRNDRLQFTYLGFRFLFQPLLSFWCGVWGSWLHTTSKCRTTICWIICWPTIWFFCFHMVQWRT